MTDKSLMDRVFSELDRLTFNLQKVTEQTVTNTNQLGIVQKLLIGIVGTMMTLGLLIGYRVLENIEHLTELLKGAK